MGSKTSPSVLSAMIAEALAIMEEEAAREDVEVGLVFIKTRITLTV